MTTNGDEILGGKDFIYFLLLLFLRQKCPKLLNLYTCRRFKLTYLLTYLLIRGNGIHVIHRAAHLEVLLYRLMLSNVATNFFLTPRGAGTCELAPALP